MTAVDIHDMALTLKDVFSDGSFNPSLLYTALPPEISQFLFTFKHVFFDAGTRDCLVWSHNLNGNYTVKVLLWLEIYGTPFGRSKCRKIFVSFSGRLHDALPTHSLLLRRTLVASSLCPQC